MKLLFRTWDNFPIYKGDKYYIIGSNYKLIFTSSKDNIIPKGPCFSKKEEAIRYISLNYECMSLADLLSEGIYMDSVDWKKLENLVKLKINETNINIPKSKTFKSK